MKTILITGASRGVGRAVTERFLEAGHTVICASRNIANLSDLKTIYGERLRAISLDLQSEDSINNLISDLAGIRLDIVVQNAGALKDQMESLASNLSSLNGVYGGMLTAMNRN